MKVVVVGGGVSGMMAAINASLYHEVILLERNESCGKKLLLTGNRRCNITNNKDDHAFIKEIHNGKFLYSTFSQFNINSIKQFFNDNDLPLVEEKQNRMYPKTQKSMDVLKVLLKSLEQRDVYIRYNSLVSDTVIENNIVKGVMVNNSLIECDHLILASGGVSFPMLGSDGMIHQVLEKKDINVTDLYPVEASLLSRDPLIKSLDLVGLSFKDLELSVLNSKNKVVYKVVDDMIFTHKGLSGPAALSCGEYVYKELQKSNPVKLLINFIPTFNQHELSSLLKRESQSKLFDILKLYIPKRLVEMILKSLDLDLNIKVSSVSNHNLEKLYVSLYKHPVLINKVDSIKHAFVTGGGVSLKEIDSKTYKHKLIHNLSICGELLDLHGPIGGYNLSIALLSGMVAGSNL